MTCEELLQLFERIQSGGVDPKGENELVAAAQYGNVLVTLWRDPRPGGEATSFTVKLEHFVSGTPDGLSFEGKDYADAAAGLLWALDYLKAFFCLFALVDEVERIMN